MLNVSKLNVFCFLLALSGAAVAAKGSDAPSAELQEGSLANPKLIRDALQGVHMKAGMLGCTKIDSYQPYVREQPQGSPGERMWRERWVITCQGHEHSIDLRFNEAGLDAADWTIE